jgi:hypothetical protein
LTLAPRATVALPSRPRVLELATDADARPNWQKHRAQGADIRQLTFSGAMPANAPREPRFQKPP